MDWVACQTPLSTGFSRQEYWSRLPFPSPGGLPYPGVEHVSLMSPALAGEFFTTSTTWEAQELLLPVTDVESQGSSWRECSLHP